MKATALADLQPGHNVQDLVTAGIVADVTTTKSSTRITFTDGRQLAGPSTFTLIVTGEQS